MIVFYNRNTGNIIGTIDGRVHTKEQLGMWIGDKSETKRLVVEWVQVGEEFEPDSEDKKIFEDFENHSQSPFNYKIKSGRLEKKLTNSNDKSTILSASKPSVLEKHR